MTTEQLRAADAAVAGGLGWVWCDGHGVPCADFWERGDDMYEDEHETTPCPPYVSGGDWRLWGEMFEALNRWATKFASTFGAVCFARTAGREDAPYDVWCYPTDDLQDVVSSWEFAVDGDTLGIALYRAGVAAGLWPESGASEGRRRMSSYTVEECRALLGTVEGRCELEATIGRACDLCGTRCFLTALPDEFEYGAQCYEMIGVLPRNAWHGEITETEWAFAQRGTGWEIYSQPNRLPANIFAPTLADALCLALAAAGLLKRGASDEDDA